VIQAVSLETPEQQATLPEAAHGLVAEPVDPAEAIREAARRELEAETPSAWWMPALLAGALLALSWVIANGFSL
jgi:hypothetical protein